MTTAEEVQAFVLALVFVLAFLLGLRSSWRLARRYRYAKQRIEPRNRPVLWSVVVASWLVTVTAGWIGVTASLRILTDVSLGWTAAITLTLATIVVFIPVMFDTIVSRVAREHDDDEVDRSS